jgi:uncharacterized spore protein YtfJ
MENNVENVLDKLSEHVQSIATTSTVIGEEFTIGDFTCKPVMKVGIGMGTGKGDGEDPKCKGKGSGTIAGAGIGMAPIGFLVAKGGEISFVPSGEKKGLQAIFDKVPDLLEQLMEIKKKKEKNDSDKRAK